MTEQRRTTGIEWCSHTWNPFVGCSIKSAGCRNCYAMEWSARMDRMGQVPAYRGLTKDAKGRPTWTGKINRSSDTAFNKPFKIREPSVIFVNSMSDFWHEGAKDEWRLEALAIMAETQRHQYQILTKRPEELERFVKRHKYEFPRNVWLGVTVESSLVVDRVKILEQIPAEIRFLSVEPLISAIPALYLGGVDWVITGGESGRGARPMEFEWLKEIHGQVIAAGVPHFFKQYGQARNNPLYKKAIEKGLPNPAGFVAEKDPVGKGGSKIEGKYWKQMPKGHRVAKF